MTQPTSRSNLSFSIDNILRDDFGPRTQQTTTTSASGNYVGIPYFHQYNRLYYPFSFSRLNFLGWIRPYCSNSAGVSNAAVRPRDLQSLEQDKDSLIEAKNDEAETSKAESAEEEFSSSDESDKGSHTILQGKRRLEPSSSPELEPKRKRSRSQFTDIQLKYLENYFSNSSYLSRDERTVLAKALDMTELQIRNWFQNKRYQKRHKTATTTTASAQMATNEEKNEAVSSVKTSPKDLQVGKEASTTIPTTSTKTKDDEATAIMVEPSPSSKGLQEDKESLATIQTTTTTKTNERKIVIAETSSSSKSAKDRESKSQSTATV